jgi:hypothetical protein
MSVKALMLELARIVPYVDLLEILSPLFSVPFLDMCRVRLKCLNLWKEQPYTLRSDVESSGRYQARDD